MILWTVMPLELVFSSEYSPSPFEDIDYAGTKMMVERISDNERRVVRILSSAPEDFLRPEIQPGTVLRYQPAPVQDQALSL
ncbi:MAG: YlzJ-like family protein [Negativicutes bacterium]|nr:YlzJ-like family protein [Negativicutes bacterium]